MGPTEAKLIWIICKPRPFRAFDRVASRRRGLEAIDRVADFELSRQYPSHLACTVKLASCTVVQSSLVHMVQ